MAELFFLLGIVFVVLKLVNVVAWSWWWVTAPFWVAGVLWVLLLAIARVVIGKAFRSQTRKGWGWYE